MLNFMPVGKRHAIHQAMKDSELEFIDHPPPDLNIVTEYGFLRIGNVEAKIGTPANPELVPEVLFYGMDIINSCTFSLMPLQIFPNTSTYCNKYSKITCLENTYYFLATKVLVRISSQINSCNFF